MSVEARQAIVNSHNIIFRTPQQRDDIVSLNGVQTQLIAFLEYLVQNGALFEVTAIKSDHSADGTLGTPPAYVGTHEHGWAIDLWPLIKPEEGAYMDVNDEEFQHFLRLVGRAPYFFQVGLGGAAWTVRNRIAAGPTVFSDGYTDDAGIWHSEDHVHCSVST